MPKLMRWVYVAARSLSKPLIMESKAVASSVTVN